jgi:hypothetical protein
VPRQTADTRLRLQHRLRPGIEQINLLYTIRYEAVNAMLLNEFLKEHQKVQRLEAALAAMDAMREL